MVVVLSLAFAFENSAKKRNDSQGTETTLASLLEELDYKSPKRSGITSLDDLYDSSDLLHSNLTQLRDSLPIYSLRSIVNDGDTTAIIVVDQNGKPYDSFSATGQIVEGSLRLTAITANAVSLAASYVKVVTDLPSIATSGIKNPLAIPGIISTAGKHSGKMGKLAKNILPAIKDLYDRRGNPIKALAEVSQGMDKEDGFVTSGFGDVPEFSPEQMPSDEELELLLEQERSRRN